MTTNPVSPNGTLLYVTNNSSRTVVVYIGGGQAIGVPAREFAMFDDNGRHAMTLNPGPPSAQPSGRASSIAGLSPGTRGSLPDRMESDATTSSTGDEACRSRAVTTTRAL